MKKTLVPFLALIMAFFLPCLSFTGTAKIVTEYYSEELMTPLSNEGEVAASASELSLVAKSAVLMEVNTGKVLYEINPNEHLKQASVTKVMSLLLIMEAIRDGKFSYDTVITCSDYAASMGGSQIWLEPGETMTVDELLKATVIGSANDATVALAEAVAGSEESFVALMNSRASELGLTDTHFINCTGLDADEHYTSAFDVAVMSSELIKHDDIKKYSTVWMDSLRDGQSELVNTNKLVRFYSGATGLKTGTTSGAGSCLAATAERDGLELCAVVLGSPTSKDRFSAATKLLDFGFANWSFYSASPNAEDLAPVPVTKGVENSVNVTFGGPAEFLVEKGKTNNIRSEIKLQEYLEAPVLKGQLIGTVDYYIEDEHLGTLELYAEEEVERLNFKNAFLRLINALLRL